MPEKRKKSNLKSTKHAAKRSPKKRVSKKTPAQAKAHKAETKAARATKAAAKAPVKAPKAGALEVFDLNGKSLESLTLDPIFREGDVNTGVIYQAVLMYQAGEREGTASTKTRGEVSGGGKKPWKQKGTGQARHGSRRSPIWRHGGSTFGPHPRDYQYSLPHQLRRKAVVEVVKEKVQNGKMVLVSALEIQQPKTKLVARILDTFKLERPLFVVDKKTDNLVLASRNIQGVSVKTAAEVNALDVASHRECLMTKAAYKGLVERLKS